MLIHDKNYCSTSPDQERNRQNYKLYGLLTGKFYWLVPGNLGRSSKDRSDNKKPHFQIKTIGKFRLRVKGKGTIIYMVYGWIIELSRSLTVNAK